MSEKHTSPRGSTSSEHPPRDVSDKSENPHEGSLNTPKDGEEKEDQDAKYPTGTRLVLIIVSICLATLLVALDATIIATAIPTITVEFNSLNDVAWYNAAFLLVGCAFQIPYGRAYTILSTKWVFLSSILIFEVGSAVCGAAPNSTALIIGRAVAGLGGSGIFSGCFNIIANATPLRKRSLFAGFLGGTFGVASVVGPLLGGAFTTKVTWRWCFYINLPIGAVVFTVVTLILPRSVDTPSDELKGKTFWQKVACFDPIGSILILISVICLQLALQWGGVQYSWSSPRVVTTLVVFAVLLTVWIFVQWYQGESATVPFSVAAQRSVAGATLYTLCMSASFTTVIYYLPIWFQAIKYDNAQQSGIHTIPLIGSLIVFSLAAGGAVVAVGYYTPFLFLGSVLASTGAGLLMSLKPGASVGEWIGYEILFAAGIGMSLEQCNVAIQTVLPQEKIPSGTSLSLFARSLGGSLAVAIAQNVFEQRLRRNLADVLPNLDPSVISGSGATNLIPKIQEATGGDQQIVDRALALYNDALSQVFLAGLILAALSVLAACAVEWKSVKKEKAAADKKKEGKGGKDSATTV